MLKETNETDIVYLAASATQKSKTQANRDSTRLKNAASRAVREMERSFGTPSKMRKVLSKSWTMGELLGNAAAKRQYASLGLGKSYAKKADTAILKNLEKDLKRIIAEGDSSQTRLRAKMCVEAAVKQAYNSSFSEVMSDTKTYKMWKTTSAMPCSHCKQLDGLVVEWDKEFPKSFKGVKPLKSYRNELFYPPRHPNCACVIVPVRQESR